jgi:DNA polymerase III delta prime subunit
MKINIPLHHAYILEGERDPTYEALKVFLEKDLNFSIKGNPDFYFLTTEKFGVDESRELKERQQQKAIAGGKKIFVILANTFSREAQNSLLKILEEPTEGTHFFIIMPSADRLLPTLQSRVMIIRSKEGAMATGSAFKAEEFIKAKPALRLEMIKGMLERLKKGEITKSNFLAFLNEIEQIKATKVRSNTPANERRNMEELLKMRNYIQDQSSSAKLILEYLALTI